MIMATSSKDYIFASCLSSKRLLIYFAVCSLCCQICNPQSSVSKNTTQMIFPSSYETNTGLHSASTIDSSFAKVQISGFVTESTLQTPSNQISLQSQTLLSTTIPSIVLHTETSIVLSTIQPTNHMTRTLARSTLQASQNQNTLDSEILSSATVPSIVLYTDTSSDLSTISQTKRTSGTITKSTLQASWTQTAVDSNILSSSTVASVLLQSETSSILSKSLQLSQVSYNLQTHDITISSTASSILKQNITPQVFSLSDIEKSPSIQHGLISSERTTVPTSIKTTQMLTLNFVTKSSSIEDGPISSEERTEPNDLKTTQVLSLNDVTQSSSIKHGLISSEVTTVSANLKTTQILSLDDVTQSSAIKHGLFSSKETTASNSLTATQSLSLADVTQFSTIEAGLHGWGKTTQTETLKQPASSLSKAILSRTGSYSVITASSLQTTQAKLLEISSMSSSSKDIALSLQERTTSHINYLQTRAESLRTIQSLTEVSLAPESSSVFGIQPETNKLPVSTSIYLRPDKTTLPGNNISSSIYFLDSVSSQRDTESSILVETQSLTNSLPVSASFYLHPDDITSSGNIPSSAHFLDSLSSQKDLAHSTKDFQGTSKLPLTMNSNTIIASSYEQELVSDSLYSTETTSTRTNTARSEARLWATEASPEWSISPDTLLSSLHQTTIMQTIFTPTKSYQPGTSWQQFKTLSSQQIHSSVESLTSFNTSTSAQMISNNGYKTSQDALTITPAKSTSIGLPWLNTSNRVSEFTTSSFEDISLSTSLSVNIGLNETSKISITEEPKTSLNWTPMMSLVVGSIWKEAASKVSDFTTTSLSVMNLKESLSTQMGETKTNQISSTQTSMKPFEIMPTSLQAASTVSKVQSVGDNRTVIKEPVSTQTESTTTDEMSLIDVGLTPIAVESTSLLSTSKTSEFVLKTASVMNPQETISAQIDSTETHKVSLTETTLTTTKSSAVKSKSLRISEASELSPTMSSLTNSKELVSMHKASSEIQQTSSKKLDVTQTTSQMNASTTTRLQTVSKISQVLVSLSSGIKLKGTTSTQRRSFDAQQTSFKEESITPTMSFVKSLKSTLPQTDSNVFEVPNSLSSRINLKEITTPPRESTETQQTSLIKESITPTAFVTASKSTLVLTNSKVSEVPTSFSSSIKTEERMSSIIESSETHQTSLTKESITPTMSFVTNSESTLIQNDSKVSVVPIALSSSTNFKETTSIPTEYSKTQQTSFRKESIKPTMSFFKSLKSTLQQTDSNTFEMPASSSRSLNLKETTSTQTKTRQTQDTSLIKEIIRPTMPFVTASKSTLSETDRKVSEVLTILSSSINIEERTSSQTMSTERKQTRFVRESMTPATSFVTASKSSISQSATRVSELPSGLSSSMNVGDRISSQIESSEKYQTSLTKESKTQTTSLVTKSQSTTSQYVIRTSEQPPGLSSSMNIEERMSTQIDSTETHQTSLTKDSVTPTSLVTKSELTFIQNESKALEALTASSSSKNLKETTSVQRKSGETQQTSLIKESVSQTTPFMTVMKWTSLQSEKKVSEVSSRLSSSISLKAMTSIQRKSGETQQTSLIKESISLTTSFTTVMKWTSLQSDSKVSHVPSTLASTINLKEMMSTPIESTETQKTSIIQESITPTKSLAATLTSTGLQIYSKVSQLPTTLSSSVASKETISFQSKSTEIKQTSHKTPFSSHAKQSEFITMRSSIETTIPSHTSSSIQTFQTSLPSLVESRLSTSEFASLFESITTSFRIDTGNTSSLLTTNTRENIIASSTSQLELRSSSNDIKQSTLVPQHGTVSSLPSYTSVEIMSMSSTASKSFETSRLSGTYSHEATDKALLSTSALSTKFRASISKSHQDSRTINSIDINIITSISKSNLDSRTTNSDIRTAKSRSVSITNTVKTSTARVGGMASSEIETKKLSLTQQQSTINFLPSHTSQPSKRVSPKTTKSVEPSKQSHTSSRKLPNTANLATSTESSVKITASKSPQQSMTTSSYIHAAESSRILTKSKNKNIIASTTTQLDWGSSKVETKQATLGKLQSSTIIVLPSSMIEEFSPTLLAVTRSSSNATTLFEKKIRSRSEINTYNKGTDRLTAVPQGSSSSPFLLIHKSSYSGVDTRGKSDALSRWITASSKVNDNSSFVPVGTVKPYVKGK